MTRTRTVLLAAVAAAAIFGVGSAAHTGSATNTGSAEAHDDAAHQPVAVNQAHLELQPAYYQHRVVQFRNLGPAPEGTTIDDARTLYEVEYPPGWEEHVARPLCFFCDHTGDGENAWDYHDHVLSGLPNRRENEDGDVYWYVLHVQPNTNGDAAHDAEVAEQYADKLPASSMRDVRRLLAATLDDGSPIARTIDTTYVFTAPLARR